MPGTTKRSALDPSSRIGKPGEVVRAITFAGGGFDTAMELGVVHALLVSQSRAPDAVVGVSAGAINAAVLAQVMQAGAEHEPEDWARATEEEKVRAHRARTAARVRRFRELLGELERAPSELTDELLPDAYQINSQEPLRPTDSPVFLARERKARLDAVGNRSGLIKLYNDVLGFGVTVSTLTRVVRRILGLRASAEVGTRLGRWAVKALEGWRLWILVGTNLVWLAPVLTRLIKAYFFPRRREPQGATAGALIFRFRPLRGIVDRTVSFVLFLVCLFLWGALTLTLLMFPEHLANVLHTQWPVGLGVLALALYVLVAVPLLCVYAFNPRLREFERSVTITGALKAMAHGVAAASVPILSWLALALAFIFVLQHKKKVSRDAGWLIRGSDWQRAWDGLGQLVKWPYWPLVALAACIAILLLLWNADWGRLERRVLRYYRIERSLLHPYPLENMLCRLFDENYYGVRNLDRVVDEALAHDIGPSAGDDEPVKSVGDYSRGSPPIHVGIVLADLRTGRLEVAPPESALVDALVGATSVAPLFPPRGIGEGLYMDATRLANEPMQGLFALLRERLDPDARVVHVYSVASLPFSRALTPQEAPLLDLIKVTGEGLTLQRYQDAQLERRLTELYTEALPPEVGAVRSARSEGELEDRPFIRAWVTPVEPDAPLELNRRLFHAKKQNAQHLIRETIAQGCRAALEVMIGPSLDTKADQQECAKAVREHILERAKNVAQANLPDESGASRIAADMKRLAEVPLPERHDCAPGLSDICEHCVLFRPPEVHHRTLRIRYGKQENGAEDCWESPGPAWPHEREPADRVEGDPHHVRPTKEAAPSAPLYADWPRDRVEDQRVDRPTISFLFSGGVFRGVFQLGAVNALSELGLQPDVVAGASVGSITGAMAAAVFAQPTPELRRREIARLGSAYLALDRLVLTDRFADFIRNLTVRAADARFSVRQADRVFRKYDVTRTSRFERDLRVVAAGIERLVYVSPFELAQLAEAVRDRRMHRVADLLKEHTQEWLDRMGVGLEVLGAEPLSLLIKEFVVRTLERLPATDSERIDTFGALARTTGIRLLATTTNVRFRRLELLGGNGVVVPGDGDPAPDDVRLVEGLLAGSAFPGVFRPRWSHEVFVRPNRRAQYIDGGVMDNIPLAPVADFLEGAARAGAVPVVPSCGVPHLLFAASLEPRVGPFHEERATWPTILRRARELSYNNKLGKFAATQRHLRAIRQQVTGDKGWTFPDLELLIVEPEWLCGTFAFHPMLGFRRDRQAASIGHGCASTLMKFAQQDPVRLDAWGVDRDALPELGPDGSPQDPERVLSRRTRDRHLREGTCWLRPTIQCPFSATSPSSIDLPDTSRREIARIHRQCLRPESHKPERS